MTYLYQIVLALYQVFIKLAAIWHPKARQWTEGRKNWEKHLQAAIPKNREVVWMHCASVGEFEQGQPVLIALRKKYPHHFFVLSFYSPSGYEVLKNSKLAEYVCYLPIDTKKNAERWVEILRPSLTLFIKYEFWFHFLTALKKRDCTTLLVAGIFRSSQWFFQWYGRWALPMLSAFDFCFLQDNSSADYLNQLGLTAHRVVGDPRVDRVLQIADKHKEFPLIDTFKGSHPVLLIGSSWPEDEQRILPIIPEIIATGWKILIAPHEVNSSRIKQLEESLNIPALRYSVLAHSDSTLSPLLIIDNIGMLSTLYRCGNLAYVGGGFGKSIHNLLEPAAHGLPVIFGPKHGKFMEAEGLIKNGGGFCINNTTELKVQWQRLQDESIREQAGKAARNYLEKQRGATEKMMNWIKTEAEKES